MKLSVRIGVPVALVFLAAAGAASWLLGSRLADTGARVERLSKELAERGQKEAELSQRLAVVSSGRDAAGLAAKAAERLAGYIAENDLNKLYKMILSMGSPEFLLKRTGSLWSRYFDVGTLEATEIAPKRWHLTLTAPKESEAAPDYYTCGPGVSAWIENGLKLTGTTAKCEHTKCRFYAAPRCEYEVTW